MRTEMSSLDLLFLQKELKFLCGGRIGKIFQYGKSMRIEVFLSGKGNFELYFEPGKLFITEYKRKALEPSSFCMLLRKNLEGQNIIDIRQRGFDRIVEILTEKNILILELFSKGNIILCDSTYNIIMPLEIQLWKDREVLPKKPYRYPPSATNPFSLNLYSFKKLLEDSEKNIASFLATNMSLSGIYAEEVCTRAAIDKNKKCKEIDSSEAQRLSDSIASLLKEFKPQLILENEKIIDFAPFDLKIHEGKQKKVSQTFTHVLDEFFTEREVEKKEERGKEEVSAELQKIERVRSEQKEAVKKMKVREEEARKKAEATYNNFGLIENILSALEKAKKSGLTWQQIKQRIAEEDTPETQAIKEIREENAIIVLRIGRTDIDIDFRRTPQENAEEYYEQAKRLKKKIEAAQEALKKTNVEIRKIIKGEKLSIKQTALSTLPKRRKRGKWFEKFRWFVTTDDFLVVGGRDSTQNEIIFKKHLQSEDIVLHADVVGAPLTVIKSEGRDITPLAIREAAEFAAAYSSAWKEKFAAVDVYWVRPEQVSKSPEAGEFLPKGSFMIRGEKNYLKKTELKISIGVKIVEEEIREAKPICGNVQAASKHAKYFVTLFPGDVPQQELAKQVIHKILLKALPEDKPLIEKIPLEEIQRLLPGSGTLVG